MGSTFGRVFAVTTFGESHGGAVGCVVQGCPPRLALDMPAIQAELGRRRPGQSALTTSRAEPDRVQVLSGLFEGLTLGTPLCMLVHNRDADPSAYAPFKHIYRPSHADYTYQAKYGHRAWAGGGRASARETVGRVAAGAVARQVLASLGPVQVVAWVDRVQHLEATVDPATVTHAGVAESEVGCPDPQASERMKAHILAVKNQRDSVGGVIRCVARGVPAGLGEPVFDKLEAELAGALLSIPAAKGFEIGSGFGGTALLGSQHNDPFATQGDRVVTTSNRSGGVQGGISNGMPIQVAVAFKPTSTVAKPQQTVTTGGEPTRLTPRGRHDPCVLPRAVVVVEAMVCLVLCDAWLRWRAQVGA